MRTAAVPAAAVRATALAATGAALLLAGGCGSPPTIGAVACRATVARTLGDVARRVYSQSVAGRNTATAIRVVARSRALADAVARGDRAAVRAAITAVTPHRTVAIRVLRGATVLAARGHGAALGPTGGELRDAQGRVVGHFTLSVLGVRDYVRLTAHLTGAQVLVRAGDRQLAGTLAPGPPALAAAGRVAAGRVAYGRVGYGGADYSAVSFDAAAFPAGRLRISLLAPDSVAASACAASVAATAANAIGAVGRSLYRQEASSAETRFAVAMVVGSPPLEAAVARADPAAARAAALALLLNHRHIVRIRVSRGSQLLADVGGPAVLAPAMGALRDAGGRAVGRVVVSIQDDRGYLELMRRFTGAEVLMRSGGSQAAGTLDPGPPSIPDRGRVDYRGRAYQAYSFDATAFPAGPLRISLLTR